MTATDFFGKEFKPGQRIVYPGRRFSSLWLNEGVIVKVAEHTPYWKSESEAILKVRRKAKYDWEQDGRIVTVIKTKNCVIVGEE